jgi:hypothetical protein
MKLPSKHVRSWVYSCEQLQGSFEATGERGVIPKMRIGEVLGLQNSINTVLADLVPQLSLTPCNITRCALCLAVSLPLNRPAHQPIPYYHTVRRFSGE